jgi:hypothetical protein
MSKPQDCGIVISSFLSALILATPALADFSGRVVGVFDGDTIEVLHNQSYNL